MAARRTSCRVKRRIVFAACLITEDDVVGKAYDARLMRRLSVYVRPYGWLVAAALACLMLDGLMQLVGPLMTQRVIDVALPARNMALVVRSALLFAGVAPRRVRLPVRRDDVSPASLASA